MWRGLAGHGDGPRYGARPARAGGLRSTTNPLPLNPAAPTAAELRRYAIYINDRALPPSRVVRTVARGGTTSPAPAILPTNLPPFAATPADADRITVNGSTVEVPN